MKRLFFFIAALALSCSAAFAQEHNGPRLFRQAAVNQTHIAFSYAGDIWIVERGGGQARRLTDGPGQRRLPYVLAGRDSTGILKSNRRRLGCMRDARGGRRSPAAYLQPGDGHRSRLDARRAETSCSSRTARKRLVFRLYSMPFPDGVHPTPLPLPVAINGSYSADGIAHSLHAARHDRQRLAFLSRRQDVPDSHRAVER